jgi:hypothetical protein
LASERGEEQQQVVSSNGDEEFSIHPSDFLEMEVVGTQDNGTGVNK